MKQKDIQQVVDETCKYYDYKTLDDIKRKVAALKPKDLVDKSRLKKRGVRLTEAEGRPSETARERILGINDMVDLNYLIRGLSAARSVCRVILRDASFREIGYGTGFKVAPNLLLTNYHVLDTEEAVLNAIIEFDFELDLSGNPKPSTRFSLLTEFYVSNPSLDYALVAISPTPQFGSGSLADYGFLRLNPNTGKINIGEFATIIQHPSGQPKQVALRENELLSIDENTLLYQSDTAQGSSGSPVLNDSWQVVGLHHSGVPRKDSNGNWLLKNGSIASRFDDDADIDWIANAGIRASRIVKSVIQIAPEGKWKEEFELVSEGKITSVTKSNIEDQFVQKPLSLSQFRSSKINPQKEDQTINEQNQNIVDIPFTLSISMGAIQVRANDQKDMISISGNKNRTPETPQGLIPENGLERKKEPYHDRNYRKRKGYDAKFLGTRVPLPRVYSKKRLSKMDNGQYKIPYEHFTIVNDKRRKLALFTASNIDASPSAKKPEEGKPYGRSALGEMGRNDREKWFIDPRIPKADQLSDEFYNKDRKAFDKGHIVRRDDAAWGKNYEEVKRGNGDTYHITNCSPQVGNFNRSNLKGVWGQLENEILKQAKTEKYCVFSGPVLKKDDPVFKGKNHREGIEVQIPRAYWKIIVAVTEEDDLQAFAFLLSQDLSRVAFEFNVSEKWKVFMVSIKYLEDITTNIGFSKTIKKVDQFEQSRRGEQEGSNEIFELGEQED